MIKDALKYIKILIIVTFLFVSCFYNVENVYAVDFSMSYYNANPCTTCTYEPTPIEISRYREGQHEYYCAYQDGMYRGRVISLNAYDDQGRTIIPYSKVSLVNFKAGTSIGINLREKKRATWNITDREYTEVLKEYHCSYGIKSEMAEYCFQCSSGCSNFAAACGNVSTQAQADACVEAQQNCERCNACCGAIEAMDTFDIYYPSTNFVPTACAERNNSCHNVAVTVNSVDGQVVESEVTIDEVISCTAKMIHETVNRSVQHVLYSTLQTDIILDTKDYSRNALEIKSFTNSKLLIDKSKQEDPDVISIINRYRGFDKIKKDVDDPLEIKTKLPSIEFLNNLEAVEENVGEMTIDELHSLLSGEYHSTFEYSPDNDIMESDNVCINVKTANIYYNTKNKYSQVLENDCITQKNTKGDDIKYIKDAVTYDDGLGETVDYWHYFIPLDTHTTSVSNRNDKGFYISVTDGSPMDGDYCSKIMEDFPIQENLVEGEQRLMYRDIIRPATNIGFVSDYTGDSESSEDYALVIENGCYFSVQTRFNVEQKFYGEIKKIVGNSEKLILNGYGFYYRPIDISKPFPNPIVSDSIWNGLYNEENNRVVIESVGRQVNLNDSFNDVTYTTREVSLNEVRQANNTAEKYTSWKEMNLDGTSSFVTSFNLRRAVSLDDIYKLGCGPDNLDWEEGDCS